MHVEDKAGQGRIEVVDATEPSTVRIDIVFEKPWKARNDTVFSIQPEGTGARVAWSMTGKNTLVAKATGIFKSMDTVLGPDLEKGLARLKATTEK